MYPSNVTVYFAAESWLWLDLSFELVAWRLYCYFSFYNKSVSPHDYSEVSTCVYCIELMLMCLMYWTIWFVMLRSRPYHGQQNSTRSSQTHHLSFKWKKLNKTKIKQLFFIYCLFYEVFLLNSWPLCVATFNYLYR